MIGYVRKEILRLCQRANYSAGRTVQRIYPRVVLGICVSIALLVAFSISDSARTAAAFGINPNAAARQLLQADSPLSPIAMVGPNAAGSADQSVAAGSVVGVFEQTNPDLLPLLAGTQANQTSLVLVGAVLVALMLVVGLAVSRKEA